MKILVSSVIGILFTAIAFAQDATPAWLAEKEQLQPLAYLPAHFNVLGKLRYLQDISSTGAQKEYFFKDDGKLAGKTETNGTFSTKYDYDYTSAGKIIVTKTFSGKLLPKEVYDLNEIGQVVLLTTGEEKTAYVYNENKLLSGKVTYNKGVLSKFYMYTYDNKRRLTSRNINDKLIDTFIYTIKDKNLIISQKSKNKVGDNFPDKDYMLDASGRNLLVETILQPKENYIIKTDYKFDKTGNWVEWKEDKYPYKSSKRMILYHLK